MAKCSHLDGQNKNRALLDASLHGHEECIELLLKEGAVVNAKDGRGKYYCENITLPQTSFAGGKNEATIATTKRSCRMHTARSPTILPSATRWVLLW